MNKKIILFSKSRKDAVMMRKNNTRYEPDEYDMKFISGLQSANLEKSANLSKKRHSNGNLNVALVSQSIEDFIQEGENRE